jgi:hypothetical protein
VAGQGRGDDRLRPFVLARFVAGPGGSMGRRAGAGRSGFGNFGTDRADGATGSARPAVHGNRRPDAAEVQARASRRWSRRPCYEPRDLSVLAPECQAILQFCRDWRSVAEISAVLRMPLGVARILIADMGADGLVRIHQRDDSEGRPDLNLLERVLSGLRKI